MGEDFKRWSDWLIEGYYISYMRNGIRYYEHILQRDLGHWEYDWPEIIEAGSESGPVFPDDLEVTRGYNKDTNTNYIWQLIFGIKGQCYIYIELPTNTHRHGIPKIPKPSSSMRRVSHFTEWMSPFLEPSFLTEHFMMRPETQRIGIDAFNPCAIDLPGVILNFFLAKLVTERIGTVNRGELIPTDERWRDCLDKLYRRVIPQRPITILPVYAPEVATAGE